MKKVIITLGVLVLVCVASVIGLRKVADHYIIYVFTDPKVCDWSRFGLKDINSKRQRAGYLFALFPSLLCPAANDFINDEKNMGELRVLVLNGVYYFPQMGANRADVMKLLVGWLKEDGNDEFAARFLGDYGKEASPALIEAWKGKGSLGFKNQIADSMIRIADDRFLPVLLESLEKDKSFFENLSKSDKELSGQAVIAGIALYEITKEDKYKTYLEKILRKGAKSSKLLAIMFMDDLVAPVAAPYVNENMIPLLRIGLKDKDPTVRKFSKEHIEMVEKDIKKQMGKTGH